MAFCEGICERIGSASFENNYGGISRGDATARAGGGWLQAECMEQNAGFCLFRAAETCRDGFDACNLGRSGARSAHRGFHGKKCAGTAQENRRSVEAAVGRKESRGFEIVSMTLPLKKQYAPMEALPATELPEGPEWQYEPKWDGFRCLAFRDRAQLDLESKSGRPLTRYFPELAATLLELKAK